MDDGGAATADYIEHCCGGECPAPAWHAVQIERRLDRTVDKNLFFAVRRGLMKLNCARLFRALTRPAARALTDDVRGASKC